MENGNLVRRRRKGVAPEKIFLVITLTFGTLAALLIPPLTMGDEGYHLSYSYNIFSGNHPQVMDETSVRDKELTAIGNNNNDHIDVNFYKKIITDKVNLHSDGVGLSIFTKSGGFATIDIMHLPSAIGVLAARLIYPSIGVMNLGGRISNLLFFCFAFFFIIKKSRFKWSLILIFTVTNLQKIPSPSYDVFSYVTFAFFVTNLFELVRIPKIKELGRKRILVSIASILFLLLSKKNYSFALFSLLGLPMFWNPVMTFLRKRTYYVKALLATVGGALIILFLYLLNQKLHLVQTIKSFINNYMNVEIMGNNAKQLWELVPTNLPGFVNIIFIMVLFVVIMAEFEIKWSQETVIVFATAYFINWFGIFLGFYRSNPAMAGLNLQGRYLSPFTVFFIPLIQNIADKIHVKVSDKAIRRLSVWTLVSIMGLYLIVTLYRSYILKVTPTWTNNA